LRDYGLPYRTLEEMGYRLPVLEISAKYLRPAVYDDTLTIRTTMREKPLIKLVLDYEVWRGGNERERLGGAAGTGNDTRESLGGELLAMARSVHAFIDSQGRPTRPPPLFVEKMNAAFGA